MINEAKADKDVVLFIDEIHNLVGAGAAEEAIDAANVSKPALSRGELQVIGATTLDEYRKYIEKDAALERRFQPILVEEPSIEETIKIEKGLRPRFEEYHHVKITDKALEEAANLSKDICPIASYLIRQLILSMKRPVCKELKKVAFLRILLISKKRLKQLVPRKKMPFWMRISNTRPS